MKGQGRTKPPLAAAIRYNPLKDSAPRLTAKGSGLIAEKIIDLAKNTAFPSEKTPTSSISCRASRSTRRSHRSSTGP